MSHPPPVQQRDFTQTWQQSMFFSSQGKRSRPSKSYGPHDIGRVYQIHETTESVAMRVFLSSPGIDNHPDLKAYCQERLREIQAKGSEIGKTRPCVVIEQPAASENFKGTSTLGTQLLILATLGGTPYDEIPYVLRHFMDPILPNSHPTGEIPVSTKPPWYNPHQWLFNFPFYSTRRIKGLWTGNFKKRDVPIGDLSGPGYCFDTDTVEIFKKRCEARMELWEALCTNDPTFLPGCIENFKVYSVSSVVFGQYGSPFVANVRST